VTQLHGRYNDDDDDDDEIIQWLLNCLEGQTMIFLHVDMWEY